LALTAAALPTDPLPPVLVSITNDCGNALIFWATASMLRNMMSVPPPGA
jgi:hypothetical protein